MSSSPPDEHGPTAPKKIKRNRPALSCTQCSSRKVKCDRLRPCGTCVSRLQRCSLTPDVSHIENATRHPGAALSPGALHLRLLRLERAVLGDDAVHVQSPEEAGAYAASPRSEASETEDAVMALEDIAAGVRNARIKTRAGLPDMYPEQHSTEDAAPKAQPSSATDPTATRLLSSSPLDPGRRQMIADIHSMLPKDRSVIDTLVEAYFDGVAWAWPVLYKAPFLEELAAFHRLSAKGQRWSVDPLWISVLCSVLALSADSYDNVPKEFFSIYTLDDWASFPSRMHHAARSAMDVAAWMTRPCGRALQASTMFGPFLLFSGMPRAVETLSIYVGATVRILQALQWHKEHGGMDENDPVFSGPPQARRQAVRRICYALASLDQLIFRYRPVLPIDSLTCGQPENYNDDDMIGDTLPPPRDSTEVTDATFEVLRFDIACLCREFHDTVIQNAAFKYKDVLGIGQKFRDLLQRYELEASSEGETITQTWARVHACQQVHLRLMRIHRPFMSTGYRDPRYLISTRTAFDSAKILLQNERLLSETGARRSKGCFQIVHLQTAIVVVGLDAWHCASTLKSSTVHHELLIRDAVNLLRELVGSCRQQVRRVARQTCLISGLLLDALNRQNTMEHIEEDYATLLRRIADTLNKVGGSLEEDDLIHQYLKGSRSTLLQEAMRLEPEPEIPEIAQPEDDFNWIFTDHPDTDFMTGFFLPSNGFTDMV